VIIENVRGVLAGNQRRYWDGLLSLLRDAGYRASQFVCDAASLGTSQTRRRVVLVAWLTDRQPDFALPVARRLNLSESIGDMPKDLPNHQPEHLPSGSRLAKIAQRIRPGQKLSNVRSSPRAVHTWDIPEVFGRTTREERVVLEALMRLRRRLRVRRGGDADPVACSAIGSYLGFPVGGILMRLQARGYVRKVGRSYDLTHTFNGKFRRLHWDMPSPTVDTRFGDPRLFLHPDEDRGLTVREAARIQGFDDAFVFGGSRQDQYRLIGNAVPPPVARRLAAYVRHAILE